MHTDNESLKFESICGVCLSTKSLTLVTHLLDATNISSYSILDAIKKVMCCTHLSDYEYLPENICKKCLHSLKISYSLKVQFEKSQQILLKNYPYIFKKEFKSEVNEGGEQCYRTSDLVIVENQTCKDSDNKGFSKNLGETVKLTFVNNVSDNEKCLVQDNNSVTKSRNKIFTKIKSPKSKKHVKNRNNLAQKQSVSNKSSDNVIVDNNHLESDLKSSHDKKRITVKRQNVSKKSDFEDILAETDLKKTAEPNKQTFKVIKNSNVEQIPLNPGSVNHVKVKQNEELLKESALKALCSKYICKSCDQVFSRKSTLDKHLVFDHECTDKVLIKRYKEKKIDNEKTSCSTDGNNFGKYLCQLCGHVALTRSAANYHRIKHQGKKIKCALCPKVFYTATNLKWHLNHSHLNKKELQICPHCGKCCNSNQSLHYHLKLHSPKKFACTLCEKTFRVSSGLVTHMKRHKGEKNYSCHVCPWTFCTPSELKHHVDVIHAGNKKFSCKYCDRKFSSGYNIKVHLMTHSGPLSCMYCKKGFLEPAILEGHIKLKHEKTFKKSEETNIVDNLNTEICEETK